MKFERYSDTDAFAADMLDLLLENEVQNNLPIGFISNKTDAVKDWLLATVKDDSGSVLLTAACTPPFNLVLYETRNIPSDPALSLLSQELRSTGFRLPGVIAEQSTARRFAEIFAHGSYHRHMSMNIMRLDSVSKIEKAPGFCRPLREEDLFFAPYWERAFEEDCHTEVYGIAENVERIRKRLGSDIHYFWEDGVPVSQAVHGRSTVNGAVVTDVYTPPHSRNKGYASTLVASLSQILLDRGNRFCALFADAENPISCGIYRKIGYRDICVFEELLF